MYLAANINGHASRIINIHLDSGEIFVSYLENETNKLKSIKKYITDLSTILANNVIIDDTSKLLINVEGQLNGNIVNVIQFFIESQYVYFAYVKDGLLRGVRKQIQSYDTTLLLNSIFSTVGLITVDGESILHNNRIDLQGGTTDEYYHLTNTQHTDLTDGGDSSLHYHSVDRDRSNHTGTQDSTTVTYINEGYPSIEDVKDALDQLLYFSPNVNLTISSVVTTEHGTVAGAIVPKGNTVTDINLTWSINKDVSTQTLTSISGQGGSINAALRSFSYTSLTRTTDTTVNITVDDGTENDSDSETVRFRLNKYYGTSVSSTPDESTIEAGTSVYSNDLSSSRTLGSVSINGGGDYIFYAFPSAWGSVNLTVNGFGAIWNITTVSINNDEGNTENYTVYTSPNQIAGTINLAATAV